MSKPIMGAAVITAFFLLAELLLRVTGAADAVWCRRQRISPVLVRDPSLSWILIPNLDTRYLHHQVVTGPTGFRGGVPDLTGREIIVCLGDSVTFGWDVAETDTYPARLQERLDRSHPGSYAVINAGIPGHSSHQGKKRIAGLLRRFAPSYVVVAYSINDRFHGPFTDREKETRMSSITRLVTSTALFRFLGAFIGDPPSLQIQPETSSAVHRVPPAEFEENMVDIVEAARLRGCIPILMNQYVTAVPGGRDDYHATLDRIHETRNIELLDAVTLLAGQQAPFDASPASRTTPNSPPNPAPPEKPAGTDDQNPFQLLEFKNFDPDHGRMLDTYHPNRHGYRVIAETLASLILSAGHH